jgi:hypothetical protein
MGKKIYNFTALTGGTAGALDSINGKDLNKDDIAIVTLAGVIYFYVLDNDNSSAELSPDIITPDGQNAGTKRWVLQSSGSAGTITGPDPSTDHAIARWDGITGKILLDSPVTVADDGTMEWLVGGVSVASIKAVVG